MQEEVNQKTVALATRSAKMTADVLKSMMRAYLSAQKQKKQSKGQQAGVKQGKTSLKKLQAQGDSLSSIEITDKNIKSFERTARKYGLTFSLKKDAAQNPPKYVVFFRGKDADVINRAFTEFSGKEIKRANRPSIRQRLAKMRQKAQSQQQTREKVKEKDKGLDNSL